VNLYTIVSSGVGTNEAAQLSARLSAWHDAMVAHERKIRAGRAEDECDDECPHAEARGLWSEAVETLGQRAHELTFLRTRAESPRRYKNAADSVPMRAEAAEYTSRRRARSQADAP
jgi:hypothetical protein